MKQYYNEILKALNQLKSAHFHEILERVNDNRKGHIKMSPTTLNKHLKFLVKSKAVERVEHGRKNVIYKPSAKQASSWYEMGIIESLAKSLIILGFDLSKYPPFFGLITTFEKLDFECIQKLREELRVAIEMLDYTIANKTAFGKRD